VITGLGGSAGIAAQVPLSFPTYTGILGRVAASAARQLNLNVSWQAHQAEMERQEIS
jgi:hypothetical protein